MRTTASDTNYPPHARRPTRGAPAVRDGVRLTGPQAREVARIEAHKGEVVVLRAGRGLVEVAMIAGLGRGETCPSVLLDEHARPAHAARTLRVERPADWRAGWDRRPT